MVFRALLRHAQSRVRTPTHACGDMICKYVDQSPAGVAPEENLRITTGEKERKLGIHSAIRTRVDVTRSPKTTCVLQFFFKNWTAKHDRYSTWICGKKLFLYDAKIRVVHDKIKFYILRQNLHQTCFNDFSNVK